MHAMILAAGLGTRLLPATKTIPKPLFPILGEPVIGRMILGLVRSGCTKIVINVHHLADAVKAFVLSRNWGAEIVLVHEPVLLGTGGAIANAHSHFRKGPFIVVNADIVADIDLAAIFAFHKSHDKPATLVMHDCPPFNNVAVEKGLVRAFYPQPGPGLLAFTGIQVLDPLVLDFLPIEKPGSSIAAFEKMISQGHDICALVQEKLFWHDIGTPQGYSRAAMETAACSLLARQDAAIDCPDMAITRLAGDGSDRIWSRARLGEKTLVIGDHGPAWGNPHPEVRAMTLIGKHLKKQGARVPDILFSDEFSGLVFVEDLGSTHLYDLVQKEDDSARLERYKKVLDNLAHMAIAGAVGFSSSWPWQSAHYDETLIIAKESRYFVEAFVNGFLGRKDVSFASLEAEFELLAKRALDNAATGFLHRDCQSRNIMAARGDYFFIDFQAGRTGPLAYDAASLIIDPYANLSDALQERLLHYYTNLLCRLCSLNKEQFYTTYALCALHRNFQILGAFSFLSQKKNKPGFAPYIPQAVKSLKKRTGLLKDTPKILALVQSL
ncbi:MAG: sugar phosphate nucleotidyltransferase [Desulfatibacillaceae bacterium]|nr:sugar phosphate nucleotidyltransferase [Desulfatibacillaceae bacterium]